MWHISSRENHSANMQFQEVTKSSSICYIVFISFCFFTQCYTNTPHLRLSWKCSATWNLCTNIMTENERSSSRIMFFKRSFFSPSNTIADFCDHSFLEKQKRVILETSCCLTVTIFCWWFNLKEGGGWGRNLVYVASPWRRWEAECCCESCGLRSGGSGGRVFQQWLMAGVAAGGPALSPRVHT